MGMKFNANGDMMVYGDGSRVIYTAGPFRSLAKVENCLCEDGKRRTAFATAEAETFYSVPACIYLYDAEAKVTKTVGGYLESTNGGITAGWQFVASVTGRNHALLKGRTANAQE